MIINVYAPCTAAEKEQLWDVIKIIVEQNEEVRTCVVGDFNSIREVHEKVGKRGEVDQRDIRRFSEFISSSKLMELQLNGRKFTWYKTDGSCKSKLDRMMVNEEWMWKWPDLSLRSLGRSFSDHCPLVLKHAVVDWGPKPLKYFNGWSMHPEFADFCRNKWSGCKVDGWKSFTLNEKLKLLKKDLKWWSKNTYGSLRNSIEANKDNIERLDRFDEIFGLEDDEIIERNRNLAELKRNSLWKESFLFQKAKSKWIKEGDMNSRFFHGGSTRG
ncbi:hypothetical protein ACS0TY_034507 [Phlomoides rotata]